MGKGKMSKLFQRLISVGSVKNVNKELPEKVGVLVYDDTRDGEKCLFAGEATCEEVCQQLGRQLRITPAMLHCFSLVVYSGRSDSQGLWLGPADTPHSIVVASAQADIQVHFRMRFLPDKDKCNKLNSLDPVCFKYLLWQVKWDFIHDKLELYTRKDKQELSRGVVVLCILIMLRLETEKSGSETDDLKSFLKTNSIKKQFIPSSLEGNIFDNTYQNKGIVGKIEEEQANRPVSQYPSSSLIVAFMKHLLEEKQFYFEEGYAAVIVEQRGQAQAKCHVRVRIQLGGQRQLVTILDNATGSSQFTCAVSELSQVEMMPPADDVTMWSVNLRICAHNKVLCFASKNEAASFVSCLDSYYRLVHDYKFSLCEEMEPASLKLQKELKAHGPISDGYVQQKFAKRDKMNNCGNKQDVYILRTSLKSYDVYEVLCIDDRSGKLIKHSLVKEEEGEKFLLDGEGEPDDLKVLINKATRPRTKLNMQSEGLDILQDLLLAENQVDLKDEVEEVTSAKVYTDSALKIGNLIGQGHFTETYEAELKNGENVVAKRLRYTEIPDDSYRHVQEAFQAGCDVLMNLQNPKFFVEFTGIVMSRTPTMLMRLYKYGSLRSFLQGSAPREHMLTMRHLCGVIEKLIDALEYMADKNLCHGNLHCDNILVSKFDRSELKVDIGDPGLISLYNKLGLQSRINRRRLPWLAPELHENLFSTNLKSDMFALGTTMWQVFSEGKNPLDVDPKLKKLKHKSPAEVLEVLRGEDRWLSCPAYLRNQKDDSPEIQTLKRKLYKDVICPCWTVSPEERLDPRSLKRANINLVQSYGADYHTYNVIPEFVSSSETNGNQSGASFTSGSRGNSTSGMAASIQTRTMPVNELKILYRRTGRPQSDDREETAVKGIHDAIPGTPGGTPVSANTQPAHAANGPLANNNLTTDNLTAVAAGPSPQSTTALSPLVQQNGNAGGPAPGHMGTASRQSFVSGRLARTGQLPSVPAQSTVSYRIPDSRLTINKKDTIGQGHYGAIYTGILAPTSALNLSEPTKVAVKELKNNIDDCWKEFNEEAEVMGKLDHKNIVKFYGICKDRYLVMEFVENRCLYKFVSLQGDRCAPETLLKFCIDIAAGMEYLSSKNVLHRDLAARNVLITQSLDAKISDFGISKILTEGNDEYRRTVDKNIPILWSAPEWIRVKKFTTKSDVWSFAVTLWEVYSKGSLPNICADMEEFKTRGIKWLHEGKRLKKPDKCSDAVYALMLECWNYENPERRPSFTECHTRLRAIAGLSDPEMDDHPSDYSKTNINNNLITNTEPEAVTSTTSAPPNANLQRPVAIGNNPTVSISNSRIVANGNNTVPVVQQHSRAHVRGNDDVSSMPNLNGQSQRKELSHNLTVDKTTPIATPVQPPNNKLQRYAANGKSRIVANGNSTVPGVQHDRADVRGSCGVSSVPNLNTKSERQFMLRDLTVDTSKPLGSGSFGEVYRGSLDGRDVAVKRCTNTDEYLRFTREIDLLFKLRHPNIVRFEGPSCYKMEDEEKLQYAMEYMRFGSLSHYLKKKASEAQPVELTTKVDFLMDIAKGMAYLYKEKILHCDLTAENVLLSGAAESMSAKISDFGWAKDLRLQGDKINSPYQRNNARFKVEWAAIEVIKDNIYKPQSDIWSYGTLTVEVFGDGKFPYLDPPLQVNKSAGDKGLEKRMALHERLSKGDRFKQPDRCPDSVYNGIAMKCWVAAAELRISFDEILETLSRYIENTLMRQFLQELSHQGLQYEDSFPRRRCKTRGVVWLTEVNPKRK